jgi:hypothetical protein
MEIKRNLTIKVTEEEIKNIIVDYLKENGYMVSADKVNFLINKKRTEDYDERFQIEKLYLEGCVVNITE